MLNKQSANHLIMLLGVISTGFLVGWITYNFIKYTQDDVFITYVYSRNLALGNGFVFNPGQQVQGTTTPLWTLIMAGVYGFTHDLLTAGNLLSGGLIAISALLAAQLIRSYTSVYAQVALMLLIASSPLFYISFGMESMLYCTLLVLSWHLWQRQQMVLALIVAGLLTWTRADGIIAGGTLGLFLIWDAVRLRSLPAIQRMVMAGIAYSITIGIWFGFAWSYFGSLLPNTFQAKVSLLAGWTFVTRGWELRAALYGINPWHWFAGGLLIIGIVQAWRIPGLRIVVLWTALYSVGYTVLAVGEFWYYTPLLYALLILSALGAQSGWQWVMRNTPALTLRRIWGATALSAVASSVLFGVTQALIFKDPPQRTEAYAQVGNWLSENVPMDATITVTDLGILGYHAQRPMMDSFGLIVPELYSIAPDYTMLKYRTQYAVATNYPPWNALLKRNRLRRLYRPIYTLSTPNDPEFNPITVLERRLALITPVQIIQGLTLPLNCSVSRHPGESLPIKTSATLNDSTGQRISESTQPFFSNRYPQPDGLALGHELLQEQIGLPTAGLAPGRYEWALQCDQRTTSGTVEVLALNTAQGYTPTTAAWDEVGSLLGVWLPDGETYWSGAGLRLLMEWEAVDALTRELWLGVEVLDVKGIKQAEGIVVPDYPTNAWTPDYPMIISGELTFPVLMPPGEYVIELNWFLAGGSPRLPLATNAEVYRLPLTITVRAP